MLPRLLTIILLLLVSLPFSSHASPPPTQRSATVLRVSDGDTILVRVGREEIKIRLYGIDAPESKQPGGAEATAFLRDLLLTEAVTITTLDVDRYGREVALVELRGQFVQEAMLERGLVWVYTKYCRAEFCGRWKEIEKEASRARVGIWKDGSEVEPWVWRKR